MGWGQGRGMGGTVGWGRDVEMAWVCGDRGGICRQMGWRGRDRGVAMCGNRRVEVRGQKVGGGGGWELWTWGSNRGWGV